MEQTKALNALEPFILLSKSANSPRAAVDLVTRATSAPNTFVFAELLATPNIQALSDGPDEYKPYLTLLQIFSYGTWMDYQSTPNLPKLSSTQETKLRQLTLLCLAKSPATLTYPFLLSTLELPNVRILEDLVISAIYAGLLNAKLDTAAQRVEVTSVAPLRDVPPGGIGKMQGMLNLFEERCVTTLGDVESQIREIRRRAKERANKKAEFANLQKELALEKEGGKQGAPGDVTGKGKGSGKRVAAEESVFAGGKEGEAEAYDDEMDIDEVESARNTGVGSGSQQSQRKTPRRGEGKFSGFLKRSS